MAKMDSAQYFAAEYPENAAEKALGVQNSKYFSRFKHEERLIYQLKLPLNKRGR
jgi:hypothetical protein